MEIYNQIKPQIIKRLEEFALLWKNGSEEDVFAELAFCLLTPQSRATVCWKAIEKLRESGMLFKGGYKDILDALEGVRFKYTKARNILEARKFFTRHGRLEIRRELEKFENPRKMREFLVRNIRGMGYKEASHFLRNVGFGDELAILDRHILKNLKNLGVIDEIPKSLTKKRYAEIEERMRTFCQDIGIPMAHLDLLLWYKETGMIFK